jgi:acyl-CoA thioesterase I
LHIERTGIARIALVLIAPALFVPGLACSSTNNGPAGDAGGDASSDEGAPDGGTDTTVDSGPPPIITHPNPIISRHKPTFPAPAAVIDNTTYHDGGWATRVTALPATAAINIGAGPSRLLVQWDDGGTYNYKDPPGTTVYGLPMAYTLDVSADSTNGADGTWSTLVTVTDNAVRTRGHAIDFAGMSWVRMTITGAPPTISGSGVQIGEIDVHDISATGSGMPDDTWFFMGDSITAFAYDRAAGHQPSFAAGINMALPDYFPAMINGGIGSETSAQGLARLPEALALNPDYRFFVLGYGTNDANRGTTASFQTNMQAMIDMVTAAGRIPIIPRIPFSGNPGYARVADYNAIVDALVASNQLIPGPDLYAHFTDHPEEFTCPPCGSGRATDNLHPNDVGLAAMNQLWTDAARGLYPR